MCFSVCSKEIEGGSFCMWNNKKNAHREIRNLLCVLSLAVVSAFFFAAWIVYTHPPIDPETSEFSVHFSSGEVSDASF